MPVLIDVSGTLLVGDVPTAGAVEALQRLREAGVPFRIITNTSKESRQAIVDRLRKHNFDVRDEEVFTALSATRRLILSRNLRCAFLLRDSVMQDFEDVEQSNPNAVVVGLAPEKFDYAHMNAAFHILFQGGTLIAINKSRYYKTEHGNDLAAGSVVAALEYASGKEATIVGKPSPDFFKLALDDLGSSAADTFMIGDDINDDVAGAQRVGCRGVLVQTGKYTAHVLEQSGVQPDVIAPTFADFVDRFLGGEFAQ
ncbi:hypothetical protein PTSG_03150 [Salpingoeca rosetta]|uniref:Haloacid dehalogenase-like hydrolase domain-containing protein 2 n=1 Tax=Salpingoeca rosetta (strain ATCC 50818 / BSB-021) TaxID=946362 RepID=F2U4D6_SALR5|nr:uncharacterized protein PTSG_03150 [Salpingoeca rosetta]EGD82502.1 hypothetical protein PTSG_03150 [Salpingoeca rosetta]|eukprot:XP_004995738.1 hypothetical protein PTSG_03150 [Salpingoeca rosetta]